MSKQPDTDSETLFSTWLDQHQIKYQRNYPVNPGNVDFLIESTSPHIYCDVKEVRDSPNKTPYEIDAYKHIRDDIKELRKKFKDRPKLPLILVTMNSSRSTFSGWTVGRALFGEVGVEVKPDSQQVVKAPHHLPRGKAVLTTKQNRSITGVLVFTGPGKRHFLFLSPFAEQSIDNKCFPDTELVLLNPKAKGDELMALTNYIFGPISGIGKAQPLIPKRMIAKRDPETSSG